MPIYEKFVGASRDDFLSLKDAQHNYNLTFKENFNFAYDVLDELGKTKPDKLAMVWVGENGEEKRFTFHDMMIYSNKAANYFKYLGIKKGDRVMLVLRRSYYFWFCFLGLHKIGAIAIQATDMLKPKDYIYRCNAAQVKCVIITGHGNCTETFDEGADKCETVEIKLVSGRKNAGESWFDLEQGIAMASDKWQRPTGKEATKAEDTMLLSFSSGTSGYPKMVCHNFKYPLGHIMTGVFWHRVVDGGLHFTISDTGWLKSLWGKMYGQWFGESAILVYDFDRFVAKDVLSVMEKYKVTTFCVPPTMYRMLLEEGIEKYDLSSLKHCCSAGEALNPDIFNKWKDITGLKIYEGFGQTETCICIGTLYPWTEPTPGTLGLPIPGLDVNLLDAEGQVCPVGSIGEICIRVLSPKRKACGIMDSYNMSRDDTAKAMHDGFYHTGDLAYKDEKGLLRYVGRNDDVIKSSGYRIGPFEIESVMLEHDAVKEVAVTGVPDKVRGFVVKATVVLAAGFEASDALTKELQDYVKKNTAPYKYPRIIEYCAELPKTFNGKIRRSEIRENDAK
ncbi:MAG: AMP-binding protein [Clostridia bacterium]|nr:AMP-binding protein [Clostridia bacterium]MBR0327623.1 AMP-binding protein [Clostridia bacterium]